MVRRQKRIDDMAERGVHLACEPHVRYIPRVCEGAAKAGPARAESAQAKRHKGVGAGEDACSGFSACCFIGDQGRLEPRCNVDSRERDGPADPILAIYGALLGSGLRMGLAGADLRREAVAMRVVVRLDAAD